jgi:hypothetical protein
VDASFSNSGAICQLPPNIPSYPPDVHHPPRPTAEVGLRYRMEIHAGYMPRIREAYPPVLGHRLQSEPSRPRCQRFDMSPVSPPCQAQAPMNTYRLQASSNDPPSWYLKVASSWPCANRHFSCKSSRVAFCGRIMPLVQLSTSFVSPFANLHRPGGPRSVYLFQLRCSTRTADGRYHLAELRRKLGKWIPLHNRSNSGR